jgi:uncharacterized protein (DUF58 family)
MLPTQLDQRLDRLAWRCRRPVEHFLAGAYRSVFKGRGIEFEEVRAYQPGDDVRSMDWKVTARTGTPHVKRFIEEREQCFYLLVDLSASVLSDPEGAKRKALAEMAALITLAAVQNNDRVGLILFSDQIELLIRPAKGRLHARRITEALLTAEPKGQKTDLAGALATLAHLAPKPSVAFILSDFLADDYEQDLQTLAWKHDLVAINLLDPLELTPPTRGLVRIRDAEDGSEKILDFRAPKESGSPRRDTLRESLTNCGVDLMELRLDEDPVTVLLDFFHTRQRRLADESGG